MLPEGRRSENVTGGSGKRGRQDIFDIIGVDSGHPVHERESISHGVRILDRQISQTQGLHLIHMQREVAETKECRAACIFLSNRLAASAEIGAGQAMCILVVLKTFALQAGRQ